MPSITRTLPHGAALLGLLAVVLSACGDDDPSEPSETAVTVNVVTTGSPSDAGGYAVSIDAGTPVTIDINGSVTFQDLASGGHTVLLTNVAPNCLIDGENPRTVDVETGETAETTFDVTCDLDAGALVVTTSTTGEDPDPDGYTVSVDGGEDQAIGATSSVTITGLTAGDHSVLLADIESNCSLGGLANPMTVSVVAEETTDVTFTVTCTALPEALRRSRLEHDRH
jgi:large repetitive protein